MNISLCFLIYKSFSQKTIYVITVYQNNIALTYFRGEIIVGGEHVAKEYFNMPDKTDEEFFDDQGKRWFK